MATQKPIYEGSINGQPLRFFSDLNDDETLWHSLSDLVRIMGLSSEVYHQELVDLRVSTPEYVRSVAVGDSIVVIATHEFATSMIEKRTLFHQTPKTMLMLYLKAAVIAQRCLVEHWHGKISI